MVMVFVDHKMYNKSNSVHRKGSKILILLTKNKTLTLQTGEGDMGVYGIAVLSLFF